MKDMANKLPNHSDGIINNRMGQTCLPCEMRRLLSHHGVSAQNALPANEIGKFIRLWRR